MGPLGRAVGLLSATFVFAGAIWIGRYSQWAVLGEARLKAAEEKAWEERKKVVRRHADDHKERQKREENEELEWQRPKIAEKPPFPRAGIDAVEFDMGTMLVDRTTGHTFKIKNVGQAPLILVWYPTRCKAPTPAFPRRQKIAPGQSIDIELTSTPREAMRYFGKTISFWTNDPARPELDLKIFGTVVERDDPGEWQWAEDEARHKDRRPKIAKKPPFPQVSVGATEFDLGSVRGGQTVKHKFTITNTGQAPLVLFSANPAVKITPLPRDEGRGVLRGGR